MKTKSLRITALVAILAAGGVLFTGHNSGVAHAATTAQQASALDRLWTTPLTTVDGKPQTLAAYKGRPLVVNFWASWCGPCVREMPALSALQREYKRKNIQFVGIGVDSAANVKAFLKKVHVTYPVYIAGFGGADMARALGDHTGGLPFTIVIDAKGAVRAVKSGEIKPDELRRTLNLL